MRALPPAKVLEMSSPKKSVFAVGPRRCCAGRAMCGTHATSLRSAVKLRKVQRHRSAGIYSVMLHRHLTVPLAGILVAGCTPVSRSPAPNAAAPVASAPTALTESQRHWIESTLATLSLRERVGQMVMVWVLGDYTNTRDSSYAEVIRWVERDGIGG